MDMVSEIIVDAVDKVKNAVVKIDLFKQNNTKKTLSGSGSGFIFSSDGLLFTNAHVISQKTPIF